MKTLFTGILLPVLCLLAHVNWAADSGREAAAAFLKQLQEAEKTYEAPKKIPSAVNQNNVLGSVVLIGSDESRGSGFLCRLWGVPLIVTNAHVFAQQYNSVIEDGQGNTYEMKAALVAKNRDLALIEVEFPENSNFFELIPRFDELETGAKAMVYGDSEGKRVITELPGKVLNIAPKEIEISCEFVPGNSGGPVVDQDFQIIGVVTYMTRKTEYAESDGKRTEKVKIQRYAIRIDELDTDEFEFFDAVEQKKDLELYRRIAAVNQEIRKELTLPLIQFESSCYHRFSRLELDWTGKSSVTYLDRLIQTEYQSLAAYSAILGIPLLQPTREEKRQSEDLFGMLKRYRQEKFYCARCHGRGKIIKDHFTGKKRAPETSQCPECLGIGKADAPFYKGLQQGPLCSSVRNLPVRIGKVSPGQEQLLLFRNLGIREEETTIADLNGILTRGHYEKGLLLPDAKEIYFFLVARHLSRLSLEFENRPEIWDRLSQQLVTAYGEPAIRLGNDDSFNYLLFQLTGASLVLSRFQAESDRTTPIWLTLRHTVLTDLEFRIQRSLGKGILLFLHPKKP